MGDFRSNSRGGFGGRSGGSRFGGRSGGFGRGGGGFGGRDSGRGPVEMHDATCAKCGEECRVPFRPTGDKPVLCSACFRENQGSGRDFGSRDQDRPSQSGMSSEQFDQINAKLDKIIRVLQELEIEDDEDSETGAESE